MTQTTEHPRPLTGLLPANRQSEGAGVTVHRTIGTPRADHVDPFLLLDEFHIPADAKDAGFPDHPHRGFETVTYMLSGVMHHGDTSGNKGRIGPGDAQWMTAGSGIIHSEMPESMDGEPVHGLQLWVNLPAADKMIPPRYQDVAAERIPTMTGDGFRARVIAGTLAGTTGPVGDIAVQPLYADVTLTGGEPARLNVPKGHTVLAYTLTDGLKADGHAIPAHCLMGFGDGDHLALTGTAGSRFMLIAGHPIGEQVARHGPFVMTTRDEIHKAIDDYRRGTLVRDKAVVD
ncbi:pirin family protein [Yunchengibacter salinarum]|uniref:pirin family protein n=1 Tax=Yunchengibacter salinarum TaxID=3133399 RepID=UPI0035B590E0